MATCRIVPAASIRGAGSFSSRSAREIPSIEEYVWVAQKPAQVVIYRRAQQWEPQILQTLESILELRSVGLTLPVARVYKGVCLETLP